METTTQIPSDTRTSPYEHASDLDAFGSIAKRLDTRFRVPGIPFRFGLDGIIGLIPGIGDGVTAAMGLYAIKVAANHDLPWYVHGRIAWHVAVDAIIGTIPLVGDIFDFAYHAHAKNFALLTKHIERRNDA